MIKQELQNQNLKYVNKMKQDFFGSGFIQYWYLFSGSVCKFVHFSLNNA